MTEKAAIIWVHEDALWVDPELRRRAGETGRAIFIWDETDFKLRDHSFKKLVFFYEALQEQNVEIVKGVTTEVLKQACAKGQRLYYRVPHNPDLADLLTDLKESVELCPVETQTLGDTEFTPNMKRFFRYWNKAKRQIMSA